MLRYYRKSENSYSKPLCCSGLELPDANLQPEIHMQIITKGGSKKLAEAQVVILVSNYLLKI